MRIFMTCSLENLQGADQNLERSKFDLQQSLLFGVLGGLTRLLRFGFEFVFLLTLGVRGVSAQSPHFDRLRSQSPSASPLPLLLRPLLRSTHEEVATDPWKKAPNARGVCRAVEKFEVPPNSIYGNRGWESKEAELKKLVHCH